MSKGGVLDLASQFALRFFRLRPGTWLAIAVGLMGLVVLLASAAFALVAWLWGQGESVTEGAPEAVRLAVLP